MKVISSMISVRDMGYIFMVTVPSMRDIGVRISSMGRDVRYGQTAKNMRVITKRV